MYSGHTYRSKSVILVRKQSHLVWLMMKKEFDCRHHQATCRLRDRYSASCEFYAWPVSGIPRTYGDGVMIALQAQQPVAVESTRRKVGLVQLVRLQEVGCKSLATMTLRRFQSSHNVPMHQFHTRTPDSTVSPSLPLSFSPTIVRYIDDRSYHIIMKFIVPHSNYIRPWVHYIVRS